MLHLVVHNDNEKPGGYIVGGLPDGNVVRVSSSEELKDLLDQLEKEAESK